MNERMNVQIQTNTSKPKLYFKVSFVNSASLPLSPTAAVAMAIDCGDTNFAITPPTVFAETRSVEFVAIIFPADAWIGENNVLLFTTEPVINTPIQPRIGDKNGKALPVFATASPKAIVMPPYVISLAIPIMAQIIMMGIQNSFNASPNNCPLVEKLI